MPNDVTLRLILPWEMLTQVLSVTLELGAAISMVGMLWFAVLGLWRILKSGRATGAYADDFTEDCVGPIRLSKAFGFFSIICLTVMITLGSF